MIEQTRIRVLHVPDCPLVGRLLEELEACLVELDVSEPVEVVAGDYPSPTLTVDGADVATGGPVAGDPRCRLDLPSSDQIRAAVRSLRTAPSGP